jgi:DNA-binding transcriptional LysR family regulator
MELRHLRYFQAVADFGSLTAAAQRLHVSQSAVSEQMADLESELGVTLFDRTGRSIRVTPQGRVFLEEARKTLEAAQRAVDVTQLAQQGEFGRLTIGFFLWGAGGFFPRIIREFRRRRPGTRLSLIDMHTTEQPLALEEGRIDVGLTRPLEPPFTRTLKSELIYRDPIVVAVPPDHRFAGRRVPVRQLADEPLVLCDRRANSLLYDNVLALCAAEGFSPRIVNTSPTWSGVLTLVEAGEGVALVPSGVRHLRATGPVFSELSPNSLSLGLAVVWNPANMGPAVEDFLTLLREQRPRIQKSGGE